MTNLEPQRQLPGESKSERSAKDPALRLWQEVPPSQLLGQLCVFSLEAGVCPTWAPLATFLSSMALSLEYRPGRLGHSGDSDPWALHLAACQHLPRQPEIWTRLFLLNSLCGPHTRRPQRPRSGLRTCYVSLCPLHSALPLGQCYSTLYSMPMPHPKGHPQLSH